MYSRISYGSLAADASQRHAHTSTKVYPSAYAASHTQYSLHAEGHRDHRHETGKLHSAYTPRAAAAPSHAGSPRSHTPQRAAAAAPSTPQRGTHTIHTSAAAPERQSTRLSSNTSAFMTQAARDDSTPQKQMSRPSALHAHTAPLRRGPSLLPSTPLDKRMLLVLDMDETLLHADVSPVPHDVSFVVHMDNGSSTPVYVKFRPHLNRFLAAVSRLYEVVVFTASISRYANQVLDYIDPTGQLVHHRLYREHCTETNGTYVKDLERLGRPLERVAIVDNSPVAYSFHPDNAVAIPSWYDCDRDSALHALLPFLERMARERHVYNDLDDIRRELRWE